MAVTCEQAHKQTTGKKNYNRGLDLKSFIWHLYTYTGFGYVGHLVESLESETNECQHKTECARSQDQSYLSFVYELVFVLFCFHFLLSV